MRAAAVVLGLWIAGAALAAQDPTLTVTRDAQTARVQATYLLADGRFVDLMRSGFNLRLHFRLELWRARSNWFDQFIGGVDWDAVARNDPLAEEFVLIRTGAGVKRFGAVNDLAAALAIPYRVALEPKAGSTGRFYFVCRLEVTTLNDTDLEELTRWLRGDVTPAVSGKENFGQALAHGAQRALVRIAGLPNLNLEAKSETFRLEARPQTSDVR